MSDKAKNRELSLAIDAAIMRLALLRDPSASSAEIQRRGSMNVWSGGYMAMLDDKPLLVVTLHSATRATIEIVETNQD